MSKISVIVPVYNTAKFLTRCLNSLQNQTEKDIEFILVDDASTDKSIDIMERFQRKDKRFKIIEIPQNEGVSIARNKGIDASTGKYIGFVDSDDYIDTDYYEILMEAIEESKIPISVSSSAFYEREPSHYVFNFEDNNVLLSTGGVSVCMRLFTREIIGEDRFIEHCRFEDTAFTYLMHMKSRKIVTSNHSIYHYCGDNDNSFNKNHWYKLQSVLDSLKIIDFLQEKVKENPSFSPYHNRINNLEQEFLLESAEYIYFSSLEKEEKKDLINHLDVLLNKKYGYEIEDKKSDCSNFGAMMIEKCFSDVARIPYLPMDLKDCEDSFTSKVKSLNTKNYQKEVE